jgi:hypothetical protein
MKATLSLTLLALSGAAQAQTNPSISPAVTPSSIRAESEPPAETLLSGPFTSGGFGGPMLAYTRIRGDAAVLVGGRGGWLINHRLVIGGGGWGVANRVSVPAGATAADADHQLTVGYGGFWTEYVVAPGRLVHGSVGLLIGAGGLSYTRFRGGDDTRAASATDSRSG